MPRAGAWTRHQVSSRRHSRPPGNTVLALVLVGQYVPTPVQHAALVRDRRVREATALDAEGFNCRATGGRPGESSGRNRPRGRHRGSMPLVAMPLACTRIGHSNSVQSICARPPHRRFHHPARRSPRPDGGPVRPERAGPPSRRTGLPALTFQGRPRRHPPTETPPATRGRSSTDGKRRIGMDGPRMDPGTGTTPKGQKRRVRPGAWKALVLVQTFILLFSLMAPAIAVAEEPTAPPTPTEESSTAAGRPDARAAGRPDARAAGRPDARAAGRPDARAAGRPDARAAGRPDARAAGRPDARAAGRPDARAAGRPDARAAGRPDARAAGRPDARAAVRLCRSSCPGQRQAGLSGRSLRHTHRDQLAAGRGGRPLHQRRQQSRPGHSPPTGPRSRTRLQARRARFEYRFQLPSWFVANYSAKATGLTSGRTATALFTDAPPSIDLDHCQNGAVNDPSTCGDPAGPTGWGDGDAGPSNSHYVEGWSIPYRAVVQNINSLPAALSRASPRPSATTS